MPIIPTSIPTSTPSMTPSPSRTPGRNATPTASPTQPPMTATGGPSPTPLFGPTRTSVVATATRPPNPNAPRVEVFTTNALSASPGESVTLYWSIRNVTAATIYRVERDGTRSQLWNVPADGSLTVPTRRADREQVEFVISVGEGSERVEQTLTLPLSCPDAWFFEPSPDACPQRAATESRVIEQEFERGRMVYVAVADNVYALFNDGQSPAWVAFDNRFDPTADPESEESFVPPPGFVQPLRQLGFVWRGNDLVRNRLGLGLAPEAAFDGFVQTTLDANGGETTYISSGNGSVLRLVPGGSAWQIITPP